MLIGDPVAATPGFGPHDDRLAPVADDPPLVVPVPEAAAVDDVPAAELVAADVAAELELELLLLLPQPASARIPIAATSAAINRLRDA